MRWCLSSPCLSINESVAVFCKPLILLTFVSIDAAGTTIQWALLGLLWTMFQNSCVVVAASLTGEGRTSAGFHDTWKWSNNLQNIQHQTGWFLFDILKTYISDYYVINTAAKVSDNRLTSDSWAHSHPAVSQWGFPLGVSIPILKVPLSVSFEKHGRCQLIVWD